MCGIPEILPLLLGPIVLYLLFADKLHSNGITDFLNAKKIQKHHAKKRKYIHHFSFVPFYLKRRNTAQNSF